MSVTVGTGNNATVPNGTKFHTETGGSDGEEQVVLLAYADGSGTLVDTGPDGVPTTMSTILDSDNDQVAIGAKASGGCEPLSFVTIDAKATVKAGAGTLYGIWVMNRAASARYIRFYDALIASVTVGTTPTKVLLPIPGLSTQYVGAALLSALGSNFGTGITFAATTGYAANDTVAATANDLVGTVFYK